MLKTLLDKVAYKVIINGIAVIMGGYRLTWQVKIGYNEFMIGEWVIFVLRILLVASIWAFVWRLIEPKTQKARLLRAAFLVLCLLCVLAMTRMVGA